MLIVAVGNPRPPILGDSPAGWRWGVLHAYETLTLIQTNLCDFQTCTIVFKRANDKQTCPIPDPSSRGVQNLTLLHRYPEQRAQKPHLLAPNKLI